MNFLRILRVRSGGDHPPAGAVQPVGGVPKCRGTWKARVDARERIATVERRWRLAPTQLRRPPFRSELSEPDRLVFRQNASERPACAGRDRAHQLQGAMTSVVCESAGGPVHEFTPSEPQHARHRRGVRRAPHPVTRHRFPTAASTGGDEHDGGGGENSQRPARCARGPDRPLSGSAPGAGACRFDLPARNHPAATVDGQEPELEGRRPRRRRREGKLGSGRSRARRAARRRQTAGRRHQMDDRPRQCLPRAAERRDGRGAAHAKEGVRCGKPENHRAAESHDSGGPNQRSDCHPAGQSAGDLRPGLQPGRRVWPSHLSLSANLLPARGLLRGGCRDRVRGGRRDGRVLGWRLGLRPAMGLRQRPHQREQPVREPLQPLQQRQPVQRQLESQSAASRRDAVRGSEHREPLWRHGTGRFDGDATGDGPAEFRRVCADTASRRRQSEPECRDKSYRRVARYGQRGREPRHRGCSSDRVGNRTIPSSQGYSGRNSNAFGGASSGRPSSGAARSSSQRGSASMGGSRARSGGGGRRR